MAGLCESGVTPAFNCEYSLCTGIALTTRGADEENVRARRLLYRLSGRQQKRGRRESTPSILADLSLLLNTLQLLSEYSAEELTQLAASVLGQFDDV
ncbi:hypothetical protein [Photorhabdus sp. SF281]|uniref:hypothetical protein n=1 Tax=Photorhabdus sp. SF281 TaxID=3459527 RepID=UPI0040441EEE